MARSDADALDSAYMGMVAELGCLACRILGWGATPAHVHHPRSFAGGGERAPHVLA